MWLEEQNQKCPRCGSFYWEWEEHDDPWHADHFTCEGCRRLDEDEFNVRESPGKHYGVRFGLFRSERGN